MNKNDKYIKLENMEITDTEIEYCSARDMWLFQYCSHCIRNVHLYKYTTQRLFWVSISNTSFPKKCPYYKKLQFYVKQETPK